MTALGTETTARVDMRGKTISTYVIYGVVDRFADLAQGDTLELLIDTSDALDNDIHAWSRMTGHELVGVDRGERESRYLIRKQEPRISGRQLAAVISDPGLEELLSPLGFALAAALEGVDVSLYFQGPAVRVLTKGFVGRCTDQADRSADSLGTGSALPGTFPRNRSWLSFRTSVLTSTSAARRCSTSRCKQATSPSTT